ncbi:hypothetical protein AVEN_51374-1 [Araneus ventricosus]|uniref:Uncharacterized protein n=1 Tax=Araneus ventricosus TaxID=182803 RepID=A0A4Y2TIK9_ARAVE|nr:hypothetical protein AVEN_51374-1 [Araneus ventricosus]
MRSLLTRAKALECVDETDDKCISARNGLTVCQRFELYLGSGQESRIDDGTFHQRCLQQSAGKGNVWKKTMMNLPPMDVAIKAESMDVTIKTEPSSVPENHMIKTEPLLVTLQLNLNLPRMMTLKTEPSEEPVLMGNKFLKSLFPEQQSAGETSRKLKLLYARNLENITFSSATRVFRTRDVIEASQTPPS